MSGVFLNYRREDSDGHAGRLYDILCQSLGEKNCFMDVDAIAPGADVGEVIRSRLSGCSALLVLIGPRWLTVRDSQDRIRLWNSHDWVRAEIAIALSLDMMVIPVLVGGANFPSRGDIPADLQRLTDFSAYELRSQSFREGAARLTEKLKAEINRRERDRAKAIDQEALERYQSAKQILKPFQYPVWTLFVVAAILLSAIWALDVAPSIVRARKLSLQGDAALGKNRVDTAAELYRAALQIDPESRTAAIGLIETELVPGSQQNRTDALARIMATALADEDRSRIDKYLTDADRAKITAIDKYGTYEPSVGNDN